MGQGARGSALVFGLAALCGGMGCALSPRAHAQVFTVGEKSATADMKLDFTPTRVELTDKPLTERGRRELVRNLEAEQGFAHRILPVGSILVLQANGHLSPSDDAYRQMVYKKGQAAGQGDRVAVSALAFKGDRMLVDFNGGPYPKHRFLQHIQIGIGDAPIAGAPPGEQATGCRIELVFEGGIPELSAPEVKALLEPLIDFGVKTGEQAYADTLPAPVKNAIASHEVLVGMNHRMVLAALGPPESKIRETATEGRYEEWIYGHQPQTVKFVRFVGDRVSLIKLAAMGKPMEIHEKDEMAGYVEPRPVRVVNVTDGPVVEDTTGGHLGAPSLKLPDEAKTPAEVNTDGGRKVQYPQEHRDPTVIPASNSGTPVPGDPSPGTPATPVTPPQNFRMVPAAS